VHPTKLFYIVLISFNIVKSFVTQLVHSNVYNGNIPNSNLSQLYNYMYKVSKLWFEAKIGLIGIDLAQIKLDEIMSSIGVPM
jgi:hypothetical protein